MAANNSTITAFYDQNPVLEHARLLENPIEYAVTLAVVLQVVDSLQLSGQRSCRILDLGGGTGRYAVELAKRGHEVTLSDISAAELEIAKQHAKEHNVELAGIIPADARHVRQSPEIFKEGYYDIVLCLGPFYHLLEERERITLLDDCLAMTHPNGFVLPAFVTFYAHLRDVATRDPGRLNNDTEKQFYQQYLQDGKYTRSASSGISMHHTCMREIRELFERTAGPRVKIERVVACEAFLTGRLSGFLKDLPPEEFQPWVDVALRFAEDPEAAGAADHILIVARKC